MFRAFGINKNYSMSDFLKVARTSEIPQGGKKLVEVDFLPVAIFNIGGEYYAIEDVCTHDGGPLAEGELENEEIICPRHGARFNVKTGQALCMPAFESVECYEVKIENDEIYISID